MVARVHPVPDGVWAPAVPAPLRVPEDEGDPRPDARNRLRGIRDTDGAVAAGRGRERAGGAATEARPLEAACAP